MRPEAESEETESCQENLCNEMQLKGKRTKGNNSTRLTSRVDPYAFYCTQETDTKVEREEVEHLPITRRRETKRFRISLDNKFSFSQPRRL